LGGAGGWFGGAGGWFGGAGGWFGGAGGCLVVLVVAWVVLVVLVVLVVAWVVLVVLVVLVVAWVVLVVAWDEVVVTCGSAKITATAPVPFNALVANDTAVLELLDHDEPPPAPPPELQPKLAL
jgi:hypothetical protein